MNTKIMVLLSALVIFSVACKEKDKGGDEENYPLILESKKATELIEADNEFALDLFARVMDETTEDNFMISPISVSIALGMAYNAAEGETKAAFEETMRLTGLSRNEINKIHGSLIKHLENADPKVVLEIANAIWLHNLYTINRTFADTNVYYYDAEVNTLDFYGGKAENVMNDWVSEKTHDKITNIVERIPPLTVSYIMNAIYFNGTWTYEFDKENSADMLFHYGEGSTGQVPGMQMEKTLDYYSNDLFKAVDLPYGDDKFSMTIMLPTGENKLNDIISQMSYDKWKEWTSSFAETEDVFLQMPKFKYEFKIKLNESLKNMGLGVAFTNNAEFPYMIEEEIELAIDEVIHKSFIDVNEEGTEAAAVTSISFRTTSVGPETPRMIVDRPFLYVIREKTSNALVFMGKVGAPEYSE